MEKYIGYSQVFESKNKEKIENWINNNLVKYLTTNLEDQSEIEHILDYLSSDTASKLDDFVGLTYKQAKINTDKWNKAQQKKGEHIKETDKDLEVVLDFKDGFKIVKLVGENAYKREGFIMGHCVGSYYGNGKEIYSLRDKNNLPHATMEKDQQVKGKGNGDIHPRYVEYVVKFLEFTGMTVGDSEMEHLGYVNVEDIMKEETDLVFPELYNGKYFNKKLLPKVENKDRMSLWGKFKLFTFGSNMEVEFNFDFEKSREHFTTKIKNSKNLLTKIKEKILEQTDSNKVAMTDSNKVVMTSSNKVAMTYSNEVVMTSSNKVAMTDSNKVAMTDNNKVAMTYSNEVAMTDSNKVAMTDNNKVAMTDYNEVAMTSNNKVAMTSNNEVAMTYSNKVAMTDSNEVVMTDYNEVKCEKDNVLVGREKNSIECGSQSVVVMGNGSKIKGKIGSLFVFYEKDNNGDIINHKTVLIDGKKVKEDVWYHLVKGKVIEVN